MKENGELGGKGIGEGSHGTTQETCWKSVWSLKVPPWVKIFLWKAYHNILPTKDRLQRKGVMMESSCVFCNNEREELVHLLVTCPIVNRF
ncbi:hypothetical protein LIER_43070 [Lithospermum erythrorhizon]|uniref:Reverse transcriptase zinc-binding domain-containing protein n=1 Tax=Lithospermum erythrorhizon TaxID=34254 RepID=A0AAV3PEC8_LITER